MSDPVKALADKRRAAIRSLTGAIIHTEHGDRVEISDDSAELIVDDLTQYLAAFIAQNQDATMIGMTLTDPASDVSGIVDAVAVQPDGSALSRIEDRWFEVSALVAFTA